MTGEDTSSPRDRAESDPKKTINSIKKQKELERLEEQKKKIEEKMQKLQNELQTDDKKGSPKSNLHTSPTRSPTTTKKRQTLPSILNELSQYISVSKKSWS